MSGIAGFCNLDGEPADPSLLRRLSSNISHRGRDGEGLWTSGSVGFACQLLRVTPESLQEKQPFVHDSGIVVVFDGRLDDRVELSATLGPRYESGCFSDPELVAATYYVFGEHFLARLNGDFALALFDPSERKLLLARDPIGVRPLYYAQTARALVFGSEIKALLAHPEVQTRPDEDDLAEYLLRGRDLKPGATFFEAVRGVPPSHVVTGGINGVSVRRYWDFDPARQIQFKTLQEYAEGFRYYFDQSVRRRIRSAHPVAVAVSGGLDSSAIFCAGHTLLRTQPSLCPDILGFFQSSPEGTPSYEYNYILDIERQYGVRVQSIPSVPGLLGGSREQVWHGETPILRTQWNTYLRIINACKDSGCRTMLTGTWGDQMLFQRSYLIELFRQFKWWDLWNHLKTFSRWNQDVDPGWFRREFLKSLLRYQTPDALVPVLRRLRSKGRNVRGKSCYSERMLRRASALAVRTKPHFGWQGTVQQNAIYSMARSGFYVLCMELNNKLASPFGIDYAWPFLDRDLIAWLLAIPGNAQMWAGVPKALLREGLADILPETIRNRRWKADFTFAFNKETLDNLDFIGGLVGAKSKSRCFGLVDESLSARLNTNGNRISGGTGMTSEEIVDLAGLETWLQSYFGTEGAELPQR